MTKNKTEDGNFWELINENQLSHDKIRNIDKFKPSEINWKIALFNPHTNGVRYLKTLIYNMASDLSEDEWALLKNIQRRNFGAPLIITYNNEEICLDYLQAVYELSFISENMRMDGASVIEIGSGYGRTCHSIMSNYELQSYYIIDLDNCLKLSKKYLKTVLDKNRYDKIHFVRAGEIGLLGNISFDCCINIDSFAEMDSAAVIEYLSFINNRCKVFYVKNPVGKYMDKTLDDHFQGEHVVDLALRQGVLKDIIDIHDNFQVQKQSAKFIAAYSPGKKWRCKMDSWAKPWSYYWQAIYEKS